MHLSMFPQMGKTSKPKRMKKKIVYTSLLIICISFLSFRDASTQKKCICFKKCSPEKNSDITVDKELNLSPFYILLKI